MNLNLLAESAGDGIDTDHADWANAKLTSQAQENNENVRKATTAWETIQNNNSREGIYGPFTVNGKTTINVSKVVKEGTTINQNDKFILEYTINPEDISARSTFKNTDGTFKEKIYLINVKMQDEYPQNIQIKTNKNSSNIIQNGQRITGVLDNIEYKLTTKDGKKVYSAQPVNIDIPLIAKMAGKYTLSEKDKSFITFTDVNEANRQIKFESINITAIDRTPPSQPIINIKRSSGNTKVTIVYPEDAYKKQYKIGSSSGWMNYSGEITLSGGAVVYAKCSDKAGNESEFTMMSYNFTK